MNQFKDFETYAENAMASWNCPGVTVAVTKDNTMLHQGAYGLRDLENNLTMTLDTCFPMASIGKSFTAMCIALLVDEAKLDWDTPIRDYAPEFILADAYATQHMTIRDILSHRTGMPAHFWSSFRLDLTPLERVQRLKHLKFATSFRDKWEYNNTLYSAIAYLVEKLANQNWQDFLHERIFLPLGMTASAASFNLLRKNQLVAKGYRAKRDNEGKVETVTHMPFGDFTNVYPGMAGGYFSTVTDLMTWLNLHLSQGELNGKQFVTSDNLKQMHFPQMVVPIVEEAKENLGITSFSYGMGWFIESYKGHTLISHSGEMEGHTVCVTFIPKKNIAVTVLTNITSNPLALVLSRESVDRALDLPHEDWNSKIHKDVDPMFLKEAENCKKVAKERISDSSPSHPLEAYVGTYKVKGYPDFTVRFKNDHLEACTVGGLDWTELRHCHHDTFEWYVSVYDFWMELYFGINGDGKISTASLPLEPAIGDIVFEREILT